MKKTYAIKNSLCVSAAMMISLFVNPAISEDFGSGFSQSTQIIVPAQAVRATVQASADPMTVVVNGTQELLAPGGTIRDLRDTAKGARVVLVSHLAGEIGSARVRAAVERDLSGQLLRVWLLPQKTR